MSTLIERLQFVKGLDPIADAHNGAPGSDVIDMSAFTRLVFISYRGVATGGTAAPTITMEACDDVVPTTQSAIAFQYRLDGGAVLNATSAGIQVAAGSSKVDMFEIRADALASTGYRCVRLKVAETVNDPVVAAILVFGEPIYAAGTAYQTVTD